MAGVPAVAHSAVAAAFPFASDRKSTRLNSSHLVISYAVFCLKKKKSLLLTGSRASLMHRVSVFSSYDVWCLRLLMATLIRAADRHETVYTSAHLRLRS